MCMRADRKIFTSGAWGRPIKEGIKSKYNLVSLWFQPATCSSNGQGLILYYPALYNESFPLSRWSDQPDDWRPIEDWRAGLRLTGELIFDSLLLGSAMKCLSKPYVERRHRRCDYHISITFTWWVRTYLGNCIPLTAVLASTTAFPPRTHTHTFPHTHSGTIEAIIQSK